MPEERTRRTVLGSLAVATTLGIAGCGGEPIETPGGSDGTEPGGGTEPSDDTEQPNEQTDAPDQTGPRSAQLGEVVEGDKLSMVIREVSETTELSQFQTADQGNVFKVVRLAVKNTTSDEFLSFSGFLQTTLKDDEDFTYDQTIATSAQTFTGGQLAPGEVSRGDVVYEVPEDATGLTLQFDFQAISFFEFDRVNVDLSQSAASMGDLSQNLQVAINGTGDAVSHEGVTVTVNGVETRGQLSSFATPSSGNEFVVVDLTTTNETGEEQSVSTLLQMLVKDGTGRSYSMSITGTSQLDRAYDEGSPIANGESRRGRVAFEVPQDASSLYFTFEFTLWVDGDKTFWQLR